MGSNTLPSTLPKKTRLEALNIEETLKEILETQKQILALLEKPKSEEAEAVAYFSEIPEKLKRTPFANLDFLNAVMLPGSNFKKCKERFGLEDISNTTFAECLDRRYGELWKLSILRTIGEEVPSVEIPETLKNLNISKLAAKVVKEGYTNAESAVKARCSENGEHLKQFVLGHYLEECAGESKPPKEDWKNFCKRHWNV